MSTKYKYLPTILSLLVIAGLFGALTHYHSESMECLQHTDEQHYAQNDEFFCPICVPAQSTTIESYNFSHTLADTHELIVSFKEKNIEELRTDFSEPRAPPRTI